MKLIQAMKKIKDSRIQADDLKDKVSKYCAIRSIETPFYGSNEAQKAKIEEWLQGYHDTLTEILRLRTAVQRTNLATLVTIELGGKPIEKSIAEWIHRRKDLALLDKAIWDVLGDRGLQEGIAKNSQGETVEIKVVRYFDPATRDKNVELYRSEPSIIDSTLEVVNAITDLIEV